MKEKKPLLQVENLHLQLAGKKILRGLNLEIGTGETMIMFGPNGAGKSSLLMAIMGFPEYRVTKGRILFKGKDLKGLTIDERARLGVGMMFQRPPTVRGVKLRQILELNTSPGGAGKLASEHNLSPFLDRDLNLGFSGGEMKRSELIQLRAQSPDLVLLDEPESGVDLENMVLIGDSINKLLGVELKQKRSKSALIITHTGYILNFIEAARGCVLVNRSIRCTHNPREIFKQIQKIGYGECLICKR